MTLKVPLRPLIGERCSVSNRGGPYARFVRYLGSMSDGRPMKPPWNPGQANSLCQWEIASLLAGAPLRVNKHLIIVMQSFSVSKRAGRGLIWWGHQGVLWTTGLFLGGAWSLFGSRGTDWSRLKPNSDYHARKHSSTKKSLRLSPRGSWQTPVFTNPFHSFSLIKWLHRPHADQQICARKKQSSLWKNKLTPPLFLRSAQSAWWTKYPATKAFESFTPWVSQVSITAMTTGSCCNASACNFLLFSACWERQSKCSRRSSENVRAPSTPGISLKEGIESGKCLKQQPVSQFGWSGVCISLP